MADKRATRESYGKALVELAEKYDYVVLDADLANGRAHAPHSQPGIVHLTAHLARLLHGNIRNALAIHTANLQTLQAVALHGDDLLVDLSGSLVGKGKDVE